MPDSTAPSAEPEAMLVPAGEGHPRRWAALSVLGAVAFMAQLDLFVVNVALPAMGVSYHAGSLADLSWVLNAYTVVFAALLIPAGRLADHFGRRHFLLVGTVVFTVASVVCALAPTLPILVGGRIAQAVGAAVMVPTSLGLLMQAFPARQHNLVVGLWAGLAAVAGILGPTVGGLLVASSWRWIFVLNVPIGAFVVASTLRVVPQHRAAPGARLPDALSSISLLITVASFVLATVKGPDWGWLSVATISLYAAAALAGAITVWRTMAHPHALIEAALFRSPAFTGATLGLFLFFVGFAAWLLISVLFLQDLWHYSALRTGLAIAPGPFMSLMCSINASRIASRFGRTRPAIIGALCLAGSGAYWLTLAPADPSYWRGFLPGLLIAGCGAGLVQAPLFATASTLSAHRATTGSAVLNTARQVGSAVGVALLVVLLGAGPTTDLADYRRGWWLLVVAGLSAALAVALVRTPTTTRIAPAVAGAHRRERTKQ